MVISVSKFNFFFSIHFISVSFKFIIVITSYLYSFSFFFVCQDDFFCSGGAHLYFPPLVLLVLQTK